METYLTVTIAAVVVVVSEYPTTVPPRTLLNRLKETYRKDGRL